MFMSSLLEPAKLFKLCLSSQRDNIIEGPKKVHVSVNR